MEDAKPVLRQLWSSTCIQSQALSNLWQFFSLQIGVADVVPAPHLSLPSLSITVQREEWCEQAQIFNWSLPGLTDNEDNITLSLFARDGGISTSLLVPGLRGWQLPGAGKWQQDPGLKSSGSITGLARRGNWEREPYCWEGLNHEHRSHSNTSPNQSLLPAIQIPDVQFFLFSPHIWQYTSLLDLSCSIVRSCHSCISVLTDAF